MKGYLKIYFFNRTSLFSVGSNRSGRKGEWRRRQNYGGNRGGNEGEGNGRASSDPRNCKLFSFFRYMFMEKCGLVVK